MMNLKDLEIEKRELDLKLCYIKSVEFKFWLLLPYLKKASESSDKVIINSFAVPFLDDFLETLQPTNLEGLLPNYLEMTENVLKSFVKAGFGSSRMDSILHSLVYAKASIYLLVGEKETAFNLITGILADSCMSDDDNTTLHFFARKDKLINPQSWFKREISRLERLKTRISDNSLNIITITDRLGESFNHGEILKLKIKTSNSPAPENKIAFDPPVSGDSDQQANLEAAMEAGLAVSNHQNRKKKLFFRLGLDRKYLSLKGASYSAAVSLLTANSVFHSRDRIYYGFRESFAIIGDIDSHGNILPVSENNLRMKIESVFWSHLETIAIPFEQFDSAVEILSNLNREYPNR